MDIRKRICMTLMKSTNMDEALCSEIELGIYNWSIRFAKQHNIVRNWSDATFMSCYVRKAMSVKVNLDPVDNPRILSRLEAGEFKHRDIAFMKPENIKPERWQQHVEALMLREQKALRSQLVAKTNRFWCKKCGKNETSYYEQQTRSGDEPMSIFIFCINCGNKWRLG